MEGIRRKQGGKRRRKAAFQVQKIYEHISNQGKDFWHKKKTSLTKEYSLIAVEKLKLTIMLCDNHLSLSAHDAALGEFFQLLRTKLKNW